MTHAVIAYAPNARAHFTALNGATLNPDAFLRETSYSLLNRLQCYGVLFVDMTPETRARLKAIRSAWARSRIPVFYTE
jgi:hypothetical protein